jgi:ribosomal protein L11 methyltransferase
VRDVAPGWEDRWRDFHRPVRVGPLWIGPPWEQVEPGTVAVVIDPGRAFGTGAHATTRLCLELLLERPRTSLADLGCGSGVLAVAAAKLGFSPVVALDHDTAATEAARANAARNGVAIDVGTADVLAGPLPAAELVCANLETGLVEPLAARLRGPWLIASGYPASARVEPEGWARRRRLEAGGWAAELFERP